MTILNIVMIVLGLLLVVGIIKEYHDKKDKEEYNKREHFIILVEGFCYITLGVLAILDIISEKRFINLMILLCAFNGFRSFKNK